MLQFSQSADLSEVEHGDIWIHVIDGLLYHRHQSEGTQYDREKNVEVII